MVMHCFVCFYLYRAHRILHELTHPFPARRSSVLLSARCRAAARTLGAHQFAYARVADIGYGEIEARALGRRAQPGDRLAAGTGIGDEHSDDHLPAGLKPLHRIGDMAAAALFGAREDAVAHAERIP